MSHERDLATRRCLLVLFLVLTCALLGACELWNLERGLRQIDRGIEQAQALDMQEAALYHLNLARTLLAAAEEQYEQADFPSAEQFLDQSELHLQRARRLHALSGRAPSPGRTLTEKAP
jgi:hypothetical protein